MENKKLKIIIIILTIITVALTTYIIYDKLTEKDLSNVNNNINNQINNNDKPENENNDEDNKDTNENDDNKEYTYEDFIRDDTLILYGPSCLGTGPLISYINEDNDIVISGSRGRQLQSDGSMKEIKIDNIVKSANAKYIYKIGMISCDGIDLYYINNNNELYLIDNDTMLYKTGILPKGKKATNSKVVEFLGEEHIEYDEYDEIGKKGDTYIKVLLEDGTVEYINHLETVKDLRW